MYNNPNAGGIRNRKWENCKEKNQGNIRKYHQHPLN